MAPPNPQISKTSAEPTLYEILALTPSHLAGQGTAAQQKTIKQAYHRALLTHHPDKKPPSSSAPTPTSASPNGILFTVDQIQQAYSVLSDGARRAAYDRSLRRDASGGSAPSFAVAGVETLDLDDAGFDPRTGVYFAGCRCGNARGYAFTEAELEQFEEDGVLMVECVDCSLWVRVLFAAAEDEEEQVPGSGGAQPARGDRQQEVGNGVGGRSATISVQGLGKNIEVRRRGSSAGEGEGRGFKFNWSFSWGISVSGSASAGSGSGR
ncbi:hypothetical protein F4810DRAFT_635037 [Camillea tinctor]|nr:hypothetical protein F4810DRAFT_635037 [Camillea tinctor]